MHQHRGFFMRSIKILKHPILQQKMGINED